MDFAFRHSVLAEHRGVRRFRLRWRLMVYFFARISQFFVGVSGSAAAAARNLSVDGILHDRCHAVTRIVRLVSETLPRLTLNLCRYGNFRVRTFWPTRLPSFALQCQLLVPFAKSEHYIWHSFKTTCKTVVWGKLFGKFFNLPLNIFMQSSDIEKPMRILRSSRAHPRQTMRRMP